MVAWLCLQIHGSEEKFIFVFEIEDFRRFLQIWSLICKVSGLEPQKTAGNRRNRRKSQEAVSTLDGRWRSDSQRESNWFARIESQKKNPYFHITFERFAWIASTPRFALFSPPLQSAIRNKGVQFRKPETIRENQAIRANLRIDSRVQVSLSKCPFRENNFMCTGESPRELPFAPARKWHLCTDPMHSNTRSKQVLFFWRAP